MVSGSRSERTHPGGRLGADVVWQFGRPAGVIWACGAGGVNLSRGYPRFDPAAYSAERVLARGEADAALVASDPAASLSPSAQAHLARIERVVIGPTATIADPQAAVALASAATGRSAPGTIYAPMACRCRLRPAWMPATRVTWRFSRCWRPASKSVRRRSDHFPAAADSGAIERSSRARENRHSRREARAIRPWPRNVPTRNRRTPSTTDSGALAPAVTSTVSCRPNQAGSMSAAPSIRWAAHAALAGQLGQPLAVRAVLASQHQHHVGLGRQLAHRLLPVLRGVADVFLRRTDDLRETAPSAG